ncbi:MKRN2 opposite strand protein [Cephus cinctus]|uniref:MKRN2 opposite strand protein n=1 Tax=Cephus cinctus TaxID=211228 RepID=A0AAJ7RIQ3_CEPCN|nr:MKRN2 opposite strand protein [Cephus cinctus]
MNSDPGILCFLHCSSKSVFCKKVPEKCPICQEFLSTFMLEPFRLPYPFVNAADNPNTIIIMPSQGDFLNNYNASNDLHIGIVNSNGTIFEYDKNGLVIDDNLKWQCCLAFKIISESWESHWDNAIDIISKDSKWSVTNYNENTNNCFSFVIAFLKKLVYKDFEFTNKEDICKMLILPKIQDALRYISFYRKLKESDYYIP